MYTRCSHCNTWFAIGAAQLRLAHGEVRCGHCLGTFDALHSISDTAPADGAGRLDAEHAPAAAERAPPPVAEAEDEAPAEVRRAPPIGDIALLAEQPEEPAEQPEERAEQPGEEGRVDDPRPEPLAVPLLEQEDSGGGAEAGALPGTGVLERAPPAPEAEIGATAEQPRAGDAVVPEVLREDLARLTVALNARRRRSLLFIASMLMLLGLVAQYAWFMPDDLLRRYPGASAALARFCVHTGCVLPRQRDLGRIRMLSRDVRIHPRYEGALQVTASLVNAAPFTQAYPGIQFTLFNVNGQTIATRLFRPAEYLGRDADVAHGMGPDAPVQIVLELLAPEQVAVSFEFRFI